MLAFVFCVAHKKGVEKNCCIVLNQSRQSLQKESAFKMHSKRKAVWIALVASLPSHCLVFVDMSLWLVYLYLSKIFQYVQMWFLCIASFVYFSASRCPQIPKKFVATKLQYDQKIISLSVVQENKIGERKSTKEELFVVQPVHQLNAIQVLLGP